MRINKNPNFNKIDKILIRYQNLGAMETSSHVTNQLWYQIVATYILGKVTKFGGVCFYILCRYSKSTWALFCPPPTLPPTPNLGIPKKTKTITFCGRDMTILWNNPWAHEKKKSSFKKISPQMMLTGKWFPNKRRGCSIEGGVEVSQTCPLNLPPDVRITSGQDLVFLSFSCC